MNDKSTPSTKEDNQDKESDCRSQASRKDQASKNDLKEETNRTKMLTRKSTRNKRGPNKSNASNRNALNGKGRRHIFKRNVSINLDAFLYILIIYHFQKGIQITCFDLLSYD